MITLVPLNPPPPIPSECPECETPLGDFDRIAIAVDLGDSPIGRRYKRWEGALCPKCHHLHFEPPTGAATESACAP